MSEMTSEQANALLSYDPMTGKLTWQKSISRRVHVGDQAGFPHKVGIMTYRRLSIHGKVYLAHRIIVLIVTGYWPQNQVDHIDGDGLNNSWRNLRCVSNAENGKNRPIVSNNSSGVMGVMWHKGKRKWHVRICVDGMRHEIGYFVEKSDAIAARKKAEKRYGFHENNGRRKQC